MHICTQILIKCCRYHDLTNHVKYYPQVEACDLMNWHLRSYFLSTSLAVHANIILYGVSYWRKILKLIGSPLVERTVKKYISSVVRIIDWTSKMKASTSMCQ
jgi:hypothetical protein